MLRKTKKIGSIASYRLLCYLLGIFLQATSCMLYVGCMPTVDIYLYDDDVQGVDFEKQPLTEKERKKIRDAYKTLGVEYGSDLKTVTKRYRKLALKHHPDKNRENQEEAGKKMREINDAYNILKVHLPNR